MTDSRAPNPCFLMGQKGRRLAEAEGSALPIPSRSSRSRHGREPIGLRTAGAKCQGGPQATAVLVGSVLGFSHLLDGRTTTTILALQRTRTPSTSTSVSYTILVNVCYENGRSRSLVLPPPHPLSFDSGQASLPEARHERDRLGAPRLASLFPFCPLVPTAPGQLPVP